MGNAATKEQRQPSSRLRSSDVRRASSPATSGPGSPAVPGDHSTPSIYSSRSGRSSRPDLSALLGITSGNPSDTAGLENRRESKQEREARKLERERVNRAKERERSMREEHVDGGYLVTQGVYTGIEDYNKGIVRQLMIERRTAPFWRGLNEHSESWTEHQLLAAARGLPIPAPDEVPSEELSSPFSPADASVKNPDKNINSLTLPITSRSQSSNSDISSNVSPIQPTFPTTSSSTSASQPSTGSTLFRGRAKTLASLTSSSSKNTHGEMVPREMQLPRDPYVNGQRIEAYLYKDAAECPICFLYYPPYLNKTRCCDQPICSECFVQIKRPDPHPPEHADPSAPVAPANENTEPVDPESLVSEPAACPFCVQPEFGITYEPPPFRKGLTYVNQASAHALAKETSAMSSSTSLASAKSGGQASSVDAPRRRTQSLSATAPTVVTTDMVRPDWHQKLAGARAHAARRSAAATALHTAAYLMGNRGHESEARGFGAFGRRALLRRGSGADSNQSQLNMLAVMSERYGPPDGGNGESGSGQGRTRRVRADDLEEMMMMEAIRLSIASEEERRKKEEKEAKKDAKKDAKKEEKETKKAEKAAKKAAKKGGGGAYPDSASQSILDISNVQGSPGQPGQASGPGKGKEIHPTDGSMDDPPSAATPRLDDPQHHLERARARISPEASSISSPYRPSHLRSLSNASSTDTESIAGSLRGLGASSSSMDHSPSASGMNIPVAGILQSEGVSGTPPGGGAGLEPMFNFRSLAAMVGEDEKTQVTSHDEIVPEEEEPSPGSSAGAGAAESGIVVEQDTAGGGQAFDTGMIEPNNESVRTPNTAFDDVPDTPEVCITAPSRTNSGPVDDAVAAPTASAEKSHVSEGEAMVGGSSSAGMVH
ncbi:MAG: hypothetical protein Q9191_002699 [Dirinaria sp. TL-2023a]